MRPIRILAVTCDPGPHWRKVLCERQAWAVRGVHLGVDQGVHPRDADHHARHEADVSRAIAPSVDDLVASETEAGLLDLDRYLSFGSVVAEAKRDLLEFLTDLRRAGKTIVGYGAPAKGNTLLNYCDISTDFMAYTVDASPHKQGRYMPGSRIPIKEPGTIAQTRPDVVLILPWNLREEIAREHAYVREWGGRFAVPVPAPTLLP